MQAYDGIDMISFMLKEGGFTLPTASFELIRSMTNVHNRAVIVTDRATYLVSQSDYTGFSVQRIEVL